MQNSTRGFRMIDGRLRWVRPAAARATPPAVRQTRVASKLDRTSVDIEILDRYEETWEFRGAQSDGTTFVYGAVDRNFCDRNAWEFVVRVPTPQSTAYVEVRPRRVPPNPIWAGLDRRTLEFSAGIKPAYRQMLDAKMSIALRSNVGIRTTRLNERNLPY